MNPRTIYRTPREPFLARLFPGLLILGSTLLVAALALHLSATLGLAWSVLVGATASGLALVRERRHAFILVPGGLVLPLEWANSSPTKYRVFTEPAGHRLVTFDDIGEVYPTLHDLSSRTPMVVPGMRIVLTPGASAVRGDRRPLMVTVPGLPWVDLPVVLHHLREGLGDRWGTVFRGDCPIPNRVQDFPRVWQPLLGRLDERPT